MNRDLMNFRSIRVLLAGLLLIGTLGAQTPAGRPTSSSPGVVRGTVKDGTGGVIPGAKVTLTDADNATQTATTGADGTYVLRGVAPGTYSISAAYTGLQQQAPLAISVVSAQPTTANIVMTVQTQKQEVTVSDTSTNTVSTEAANNASALVLKPEDLDALPDDPDDLEADLTALAGPSAGPGGNQIYIDGFTGGRLPPKESIREIRINSNPFSAEFDKLGYGRIQIFTKPGSDKFHGQGYYNISDGVWNSRNPFLSVNPPFRTQLFGGNVSGPLGKHASFFIDTERRNIDDNGIITATIPTPDFLNHYSYQNFYSTPQRRTTVSPRVDYQLGTNNTLSFRYAFLDNQR
ncbi:MAG: carboxypeptidase-like regulatory domain-containing protein, partial [Acidobacteriota bacterium]|nr:carboxypeptidase-like regulatory domain-containing protein [Acidobacteriota bacterium]